ncbi:hypothetical protein D3C72_904600 [compost metagenome]
MAEETMTASDPLRTFCRDASNLRHADLQTYMRPPPSIAMEGAERWALGQAS